MSKGFTPDRQSFEQILLTASLVQQLRKHPMCSRPAGCDDSQRITDLAVAQLLAWLRAQLERAELLQAIERVGTALERLVRNEEGLQHGPPSGLPASIVGTSLPGTRASSSLRMAQLTQNADQAARDPRMVDGSLTTAEAVAEITKLPRYPSHVVGAIEKADDSRAIFRATLELVAAPRTGNHEPGDTVQIDLAPDGVVPTPIQLQEVASGPAVAGNEWVMLSQSKTLAARGKIFEARDKVLSLLKADNSVP
jgi:hypothetical protein